MTADDHPFPQVWLLLSMSHPRPWMLRLEPAAVGFRLTPTVFVRAVLQHSLREWHRVRKCFEAERDVRGGRETLTHLLRTCVLAVGLRRLEPAQRCRGRFRLAL